MVEHFLDTEGNTSGSALGIDGFSQVGEESSDVLSNRTSNTGRFVRVERYLRRNVRNGELWFVGRDRGRVVWKRLRTPDVRTARVTVAMIRSQLSGVNGNTAVFLIEDGKETPIPEAQPVIANDPLPCVRQVLVNAERAGMQRQTISLATASTPAGVPTLDEFLTRWRRSRAGQKPATERKLDDYLKMTRRYVDVQRPVTDYKAQDIRDAIAKARSDKVKGRRRLKGQTINEAIWRTLKDAFDLAFEEKFISRNPLAFVDREKPAPINRQQHNWADAERILEDVKERALESYLELKFMLLIGVGQAEAKDLRGGRIDWLNNKITFIRQKTGKAFTVPIYPWAENFIRSEIEPRLKPDNPVFEWRNPRKALETSCRNLELPRVEIRSLRRTLIVHLIHQHVDIRLIARWQGHANAQLIFSRYGEFIDSEYEQQELEKLKLDAGVQR